MVRTLLLATLVLALAAPAAALTPSRYRALDAMLTAEIRLGADNVTTAQVARVAEACATGAMSGDVVVRRHAGMCTENVAVTRNSLRLRTCKGTPCAAIYDAGATAVGRYLAAGRALNRVLGGIPEARCRAALDVGKTEQRGLRTYANTLGAIADAIRAGDRARFEREQERLGAITGVPTGAQNRASFRVRCG